MNAPSTRAQSHARERSSIRADSRRNPSLASLDREIPGGLECQICFDVKPEEEFPSRRMTEKCKHDATDCCSECLNHSISTAFEGNMWDDIRCPICNEQLQFQDMAELAPPTVFERSDLSIRSPFSLIADTLADTTHSTSVEHLSKNFPTSAGASVGTVPTGKNIPRTPAPSLHVVLVGRWLVRIITCFGTMKRRARNTIGG